MNQEHKYIVKILDNKIVLESNLPVTRAKLSEFAKDLVEEIRGNGYNVELESQDFIMQTIKFTITPAPGL